MERYNRSKRLRNRFSKLLHNKTKPANRFRRSSNVHGWADYYHVSIKKSFQLFSNVFYYVST